MLNLNKMLFRFGKVESHLKKLQLISSAVVHFHKIFGHKLKLFFSSFPVLGYMEVTQNQRNMIFNHNLLI